MGYNPNFRGNEAKVGGVDLSSSVDPAGSSAIGDNDNYVNISPASPTVKAALVAIDSALGGGGGGSPGGANGELQFNNGGSFGGASGITTNGTALRIGGPGVGASPLTVYFAGGSTNGVYMFAGTNASDPGFAIESDGTSINFQGANVGLSEARIVRFNQGGGDLFFGNPGSRVEFESGVIDNNQNTSEAVVWENGVTGSRPGSPVLGQRFFDTTLGIPIWFDGSNWVNALGATV